MADSDALLARLGDDGDSDAVFSRLSKYLFEALPGHEDECLLILQMARPRPRRAMTAAELRAEIKVALADLYTPDEAETWLTSRHPLLDGKTAEEMIASGEGERVLQLIRQLDEGVYL